MGKLFDNPAILVILIVAVIVIFGSKRLPDAARGVGRSLRILKAETKGLMTDDEGAPVQQVQPATPAAQTIPAAAPAPAPAAQPVQQPVAQPVQQPVAPPQTEQPVPPPPAPAPDQPQA